MINDILFNSLAFLSIGGLLTVYIILLIQYFHRQNSNNKGSLKKAETTTIESRYQYSSLDMETMNSYAKQLESFLNESEIYLEADLSLDLLSKEVNIPRHSLTQLFNIHYNKNFFQLMAEYRIAYAVKTIKEGRNIKMQSLAHECGYNSVTSFYKYFKELIGTTPSEYRNTEEINPGSISA